MAEDKKDELVFDGMPGADAKTEEDVKPFQVDMNFETPRRKNVEETETEETTEEEPVAEETTEEVAEEQVEEPVAEETESPESEETEQESVQGDDEQPVEAVEEGSNEPEVEEVEEEPKAPMVPKSRLDEVLAKNKEMQKIIQDMEGKETPEDRKAPRI